ncbi:EAL domain-containing protein [Aneurinibacillus sp. BA2021]|nr:EAL domain-containing protein [Aneurinibacillus sp. BA2021]
MSNQREDVRLQRADIRAMLIVFVAVLIFLLVRMNREALHGILDPPNYLSIHILLEVFGICVAFSIALQGWMIFPHTMSRHRLLVGAVFGVLGVFEILHMLSYKGMPFFITESSIPKATWFWIAQRFTESCSLLLIFLFKDATVPAIRRYTVIAIAALYSLSVSLFIMFNASKLPVLVVEGVGLTPLKIGLEYTFCFINVLTIYMLLRQYRVDRQPAKLTLILACIFFLLCSLEFTTYKSVYDFDNLLGHIYQFFGIYFMLKGIYFATIEEPYVRYMEAKEELYQSEKYLRTITSTLGEGVLVTDKRGCVTFMNPEAERLLGYRREELAGAIFCEKILYGSHKIDFFFNGEEQYKSDDEMFIRKNGTVFHVSCVFTWMMEERERTGTVIAFNDITERKQQQRMIEHMAYYDSLTQLPNRALFHKRLGEAIEHTKQTGQPFALFYLDLDNFKYINDALGHSFGDRVIQAIADKLQHAVKQEDTVSRDGGDEFSLLLTGITLRDVEAETTRILAVFNKSYTLKEHDIHVTASIGVAVYEGGAEDAETLVRYANIALYDAKKEGKDTFRMYSMEMQDQTFPRVFMESALRKAVEKEELVLYYQPQVDIRSGMLLGVEALIRWIHPERGLIPPDEFIPLAEETGLIESIGEWVLETGCRQVKAWEKAGFPLLRLSVNLSGYQFRQPQLIHSIQSILERTGMSPAFVDIEITESMTMNVERTITTLYKLKGIGVQISMDDFGTGYSSLSYLKQFPIDRLKIDRSFIFDLPTNMEDRAIVSTIIAMAQNLQLKVVAEGVETEEHLNLLRYLCCDEAQGYFFAKPLPARELEQYLIEGKLTYTST